jgi:endonuclease-3
MSRLLAIRYDGVVPNSAPHCETLPGVGRKTADVVLNMWWGPACAGGRHAYFSGCQRYCTGQSNDTVERAIEDNITVFFARPPLDDLHGRYITVARKPKCQACHIRMPV